MGPRLNHQRSARRVAAPSCSAQLQGRDASPPFVEEPILPECTATRSDRSVLTTSTSIAQRIRPPGHISVEEGPDGDQKAPSITAVPDARLRRAKLPPVRAFCLL